MKIRIQFYMSVRVQHGCWNMARTLIQFRDDAAMQEKNWILIEFWIINWILIEFWIKIEF